MSIGVDCEWVCSYLDEPFRGDMVFLTIAAMAVIVKAITIITATGIGSDTVGTRLITPSSVLGTLIDICKE